MRGGGKLTDAVKDYNISKTGDSTYQATHKETGQVFDIQDNGDGTITVSQDGEELVIVDENGKHVDVTKFGDDSYVVIKTQEDGTDLEVEHKTKDELDDYIDYLQENGQGDIEIPDEQVEQIKHKFDEIDPSQGSYEDRSTANVGITYQGTNFNDVIMGGAGDDTLRGFDGDDVIIGGAGDDTIYGGRGINYLQGGEGFDDFTFDQFVDPSDIAKHFSIIEDFKIGDDTIDISGALGRTQVHISRIQIDDFGDALYIEKNTSEVCVIVLLGIDLSSVVLTDIMDSGANYTSTL